MEDERRLRREREHAAVERLAQVHGALELQAAVLALLLPATSQRALRVWSAETEEAPAADELREHVAQLPRAARLPWFETLVSRLRAQPLAARQGLLEATRRVMSARGAVRPIDRLHWLAMRQRLGDPTGADTRTAAATELSQLPQSDVSAIASYSAFLSRMVPVEATAQPEVAAIVSPGLTWYDQVMSPWRARAIIAPCQPPDTDGLVHALRELQALAWMQRPMLARGWVTAAEQHSRHGRLTDGAADALRLSCALLDSPLPPALARHYAAVEPEPAAP